MNVRATVVAATAPAAAVAPYGLSATIGLVAAGVGYVPGSLLQVIAGGGALSSVAAWFIELGARIGNVGIGPFQLAFGVLLIIGGIAVDSHRLAVRRFERFSPPMWNT